jgi:transcriptional regulator
VDGALSVAVFHGPHGYVSPSVYGTPGVPTWNYVVVHARGRACALDAAATERVIVDSVERFERAGWRLDTNDASMRRKLMAICGFEIAIESLLGKWKLSQNRPPEDRARVIEWLEGGDDASRAAAALMRSP